MAITGGGLTGQWLGDYQLQGVLGVGGMAEVYQARDAVINRDVAVKVLPLALAADPNYVERFRNEAQAVGALNHPNIVPVHHFGEQGPYLYLVMPLMKESLRDRLLRGVPLPAEEAVQIAVQILSGLGAAHAQGVVHRDVKPENILLDENGVAKLTDFGIARRITIQRASGGPTLAGTGLPVGTPQYMAPEQLRGEDLDQRADIYALGSVLYEMLTGLPPHIADTPYEVASLVLTTDAAPPSTRNPEIWPELEQVMLKALSRKTANRYANATSFAEALQDALLAHDIELIEPASAVKSSYVKFRASHPPSKANGDSSGGQGSIWSDGQPQNPSESPPLPPPLPAHGAPPAGNPPRWPPSNQPRDNGAGDGGPGRRILIFALVAAIVLLGVCGAGVYATGIFPIGGGGTIRAQNTATSDPGELSTVTPAPTDTVGLGTPTSTPAPTKTAKPGATPTNTLAPTPTNTPVTSILEVDSPPFTLPSRGGGLCGPPDNNSPTFIIINHNSTPITWQWTLTSGGSLSGFAWADYYQEPPKNYGGLPNGTIQGGALKSFYLNMPCNGNTYTFTMTDNRGHSYPTMQMTVAP